MESLPGLRIFFKSCAGETERAKGEARKSIVFGRLRLKREDEDFGRLLLKLEDEDFGRLRLKVECEDFGRLRLRVGDEDVGSSSTRRRRNSRRY